MNTKPILHLIAIIFLCAGIVKGQNNGHTDLVLIIDSIAKARNIENGMIKFHRVTSQSESTVTESFSLSRKQKFTFDGPCLVMGDNYFNMEKLLFFFVREDYIEFYFQGY